MCVLQRKKRLRRKQEDYGGKERGHNNDIADMTDGRIDEGAMNRGYKFCIY